MRLVLIETSGNQSYIFASNKLRENVGASELTHRVGSHAEEAFAASALTHRIGSMAEEAAARQGGPAPGSPAEVILATSGKALILAEDPTRGKAIVRDVTTWAVKNAPGMDVRGVVSREFDYDNDPIHSVVREVHEQHQRIGSEIPSPLQRFARLPVVAECATSGLPAAELDLPSRAGERGEPRSLVSLAKRKVAEKGLERMRRTAGAPLARSVDDLDNLDDVEWLAVVHADGNGIGQIFLQFDRLVKRLGGGDDNRTYVRKLREFSQALDGCTERAFAQALKVFRPRRRGEEEFLPVVPLVLGGDDLTVVCEGRSAVPFTVAYLREFERETSKGIVADLARQRENMPHGRLSACAGVAVVKPHFPFHAAYELSEQLAQSAKVVKEKVPGRPCSAFDYHILYDSSGADLDRIRAHLITDDGATHLTARPYVVTEAAEPTTWAERRGVKRLVSYLQTLNAEEDDRRRLPNSLLHDLRESLFLKRQTSDRRLELALGRHPQQYFGDLVVPGETGGWSLFWKEEDEYYTALLDAMDLVAFWEDARDAR